MFAWVLSAAVAFVVFGTAYNIVKKLKPHRFDGDNELHWFFIGIASVFWMVTLPILATIVAMLLLKILIDIRKKLQRIKK
jgi:chromate transport protein ChrA